MKGWKSTGALIVGVISLGSLFASELLSKFTFLDLSGGILMVLPVVGILLGGWALVETFRGKEEGRGKAIWGGLLSVVTLVLLWYLSLSIVQGIA